MNAMVPQIFDKRPPFVRFEEQEVGLDAEASKKAGRPIPRTQVLAIITPHGSKDEVHRVAEEWLTQIRNKAAQGFYDPQWVTFFERQYEEWKKGNELPREGVPIRTWQMVTNESRRRILAAGYSTVEDLAQCPEQGLSMIGLDGRYWRDTARAWLKEGSDKGTNAKEIADLRSQLSERDGQIERLTNAVTRLEARLTALASEPASEATAPRRRRAAGAEPAPEAA